MADNENSIELAIESFKAGFESGWSQGELAAKDSILRQIKALVCFDALAAYEWRCEHHGGKCYELGVLFDKLGGER